MRNLKRALSLTLASVMLLGMMVVGTGASYKDADSIEHKDAVEVLNAISVMSGDDQGNFNPEQVVTRAEMAVIVCKMLYGDKLDVSQFTGTKVFTDVPAWAEGFVNLAASLDIVAGVGDGKFAPNEPVTTAQATLMLCKALGYFQTSADFGQDWALAAIKKGTQLGMFKDLNSLATNAGLKRDDVAALTFAAITDAVPVMYNELLGVYYNDSNNVLGGVNFYYDETLAYKNFDLVYKDVTDDLGQVNTRWGIGSVHGSYMDAKGNLISSQVTIAEKDKIVDVEKTPILTYTTDLNKASGISDINRDLKGYDCDEGYTRTVNGVASTIAKGTALTGEVVAPLTGDGYSVKIYANNSGVVTDVAVIREELAKVVAVNSSKKTITVQTTAKNVVLEEDDDVYAQLVGQVKADDYVLVVYNSTDGIVSAALPKTVTGVVTNYTNKAVLTVDGVDYKPSDCGFADTTLKAPAAYTDTTSEATLYLDSNGYVVAVNNEIGVTGQNIAYVAHFQESDDYGNAYEAYVYLPDGTKGVYNVVSYNSNSKLTEIAKVTAKELYIFELTDNGIRLKDTGDSSVNVKDFSQVTSDDTITLNKDTAKYTVDDTVVYLNSETVFYVRNTGKVATDNATDVGKDGYIATSTGLSSIKNGTEFASGDFVVAYKTVGNINVATAVFAKNAASVSATSEDLIFVSNNNWKTNGDNFYKDVVMPGKDAMESIVTDAKYGIGLYSYKADSKGVYTLDADTNGCGLVGELVKVTDKLLYVGDTQLNNLDKALVFDATDSETVLTSASYLDIKGLSFSGYVAIDNTTDMNVVAVYITHAVKSAADTTKSDLEAGDIIFGDGADVNKNLGTSDAKGDTMVFAFETANDGDDATLVIKDGKGEQVYTEGPTDFAKAGIHFYYITLEAKTQSAPNAGTGTWKNADATSGTYSYEITIGGETVASGNFMVG